MSRAQVVRYSPKADADREAADARNVPKRVPAVLKCDFRSTPVNGHHQTGPLGPVRATSPDMLASDQL